MKRIKMGGLNVLLLFAHNAPSEQHTPTRGVIWYVQSYLVLHLHAKKRLATNKQKTRTQRRSLKEDGVDLIEFIILWGAHKEHKAEAADTGIIIARIY